MDRSETVIENDNPAFGNSLRAAVLGANDGILSTASVMLGIAGASSDHNHLLLGGVAALVAGAMSMAAGEYISVSAQRDLEKSELVNERLERVHNGANEAGVRDAINGERYLVDQLTVAGLQETDAQDELEIANGLRSNPILAAFSSATSFVAGGLLPLVGALASPATIVLPVVAISSVAGLSLLGYLTGKFGAGVNVRTMARTLFWGVAAMGVTHAAGRLFGSISG